MRNKYLEVVMFVAIIGLVLFGAREAAFQQRAMEHERNLNFIKYVDTQIELDRKLDTIEGLSLTLDASEKYRIQPSLASLVIKYADKCLIPHDIAFRLIRRESSFNPNAVSHAGAIGLGQVMPTTAQEINALVGPEELRDPATNLEIGFCYLQSLHERTGNWRDALRSYYAGPYRASRDSAIGTEYASSILNE